MEIVEIVEIGTNLGVHREKVLIFSGRNSHPATESIQPVAMGANRVRQSRECSRKRVLRGER